MSIYGKYVTEGLFTKKDSARKEIMNISLDIIKRFVLEDGIIDALLSASKNFGENGKFLENKGNTFKISIDSKANRAAAFNGGSNPKMFRETGSAVLKCVSSNKSNIEKEIKEKANKSVNISYDSKMVGGSYIIITLK